MTKCCPACEAKRVPDAAFCHLCGTAFEPASRAPADTGVPKRRRKKKRVRRESEDSKSTTRFDERRPRRDGAKPARETDAQPRRSKQSARAKRATVEQRTSRKRKRKRPSGRPEPGKLRAASDDVEREIWSDTFSAKGLINYWLAVGAGSVVLPTAAVYAGADATLWKMIVAIVAAAWVVMIGWLIFLKLDAYYVLTTQRFLHERGILTRHTRRIEVIDIDDVSFRQGIIERFLNVGSIEIISSDKSDPIFEFDGIDNVHEVALVIDEARRAERVRRGIHIESV